MILLLAGTSDAKKLASELVRLRFPLIATTVTENGAKQLREVGIRVEVGRLCNELFPIFLKEKKITFIIDATHPFAEEGSKNALFHAKMSNIPYVRFERKSLLASSSHLVTIVKNYEEAIEVATKRRGIILLSTGSKTLSLFAKKLLSFQDIKLLIRFLPTVENLQLCQQLQIPQKNIIAMQGPFSKELNKALFKQFGVTLLITKESGKEGSFQEKVEAAIELGIETIIIQRPSIQYGTVFSEMDELVCYINQIQGE